MKNLTATGRLPKVVFIVPNNFNSYHNEVRGHLFWVSKATLKGHPIGEEYVPSSCGSRSTFHSDPPRADTLGRSAKEGFPFRSCPTPSEPPKSTSGEKAACPFLSLPTKNLDIPICPSNLQTPY